MNSSVRVLFAQVEGSDETIQHVLQQFVDHFSPSPVPVIAGPPEPEPMRVLLDAAEPESTPRVKRTMRQRKQKALPASSPRVQDESRPTISGVIREAVKSGPKTNGEIVRYVQTHGFPDVNSATVSTILCQRRAANEMYKDDATYCWHMAKQADPR